MIRWRPCPTKLKGGKPLESNTYGILSTDQPHYYTVARYPLHMCAALVNRLIVVRLGYPYAFLEP